MSCSRPPSGPSREPDWCVLAGPDIFLRIDAGPIRRARGLEYAGMSRSEIRQWQPVPDPETPAPDLAALLGQVARGDHRAFELVYAELSGPVYGVVRQVLRDP